MLIRSPRLVYLLAIKMLVPTVSADAATAPLEIPFNTTATMGPDGPWNFITLNVGSGSTLSSVSFFPQVLGDISLLTSAAVCRQNSSLCVYGAEYYDEQASSTQTSPSGLSPYWQRLNWTSKLGQSNYTNIQGNVSFWEESFNAPLNTDNTTVLVAQNSSGGFGKTNYSSLSLLQLDCNSNSRWDLDLNKTKDGTQQGPSLTCPVRESSQNGRSPSYNLHLGYAMYDQPGSLYFGGYDSKRIIEPMKPFQPGNLTFGDLTFETVSGPSPWQGNYSGEFLAALYSSTVAAVILAPEHPYMSMPATICDFMAQKLPIYEDYASGLYFWNMENPKYHEIMSSSSYLNFTIGTGNDTVAIKVPFLSLNLTLESPVTKNPTPYFPLYRSDYKATILGRAFLQSANLGYVGDEDSIIYNYLGQAPGPSIGKNTTPNPVPLSIGSYAVPSDAPSWEESWADTWAKVGGNATTATTVTTTANTTKPISSSASTESNPTASRPGLSGGQIAGINLGVILAVGLVAFGLRLLFIRRSRRSPQSGELSSLNGSRGEFDGSTVMAQQLDSRLLLQEKDSQEKVELGGMKGHYMGGMNVPEKDGRTCMHELSATSGPIELPIKTPS